jgi:hypothetical protein
MTQDPISTRKLSMIRRCLTMALAISATFATAAQAQTGPGSIYYLYEPTAHYRVAGNGTQNVKIGDYPFPTGKVTSLSTYPGGRQLQRPVVAGTIPGSTASFSDITLYAETTGAPTTVTSFRGPQYIEFASRYQVSNDHNDSFFSFVAYDPVTGSRILYRSNGPIADVFAPGFQPFVSGDSRLTAVTNMPGVTSTDGWDGSGTLFFFFQASPTTPSNSLLYVYDVTHQSTTLLNDPAISGLSMEVGRCSSTELRLFSLATVTATGAKGIVSFYPATGQYTWVIQEGGSSTRKISSFTQPAISPDGTVLAFGLFRTVNGLICPTLARIPVSGGSYTPLVTFPGSRTAPTNRVDAGSQGWTW